MCTLGALLCLSQSSFIIICMSTLHDGTWCWVTCVALHCGFVLVTNINKTGVQCNILRVYYIHYDIYILY